MLVTVGLVLPLPPTDTSKRHKGGCVSRTAPCQVKSRRTTRCGARTGALPALWPVEPRACSKQASMQRVRCGEDRNVCALSSRLPVPPWSIRSPRRGSSGTPGPSRFCVSPGRRVCRDRACAPRLGGARSVCGEPGYGPDHATWNRCPGARPPLPSGGAVLRAELPGPPCGEPTASLMIAMSSVNKVGPPSAKHSTTLCQASAKYLSPYAL